jgi:Tfp pilus assembly protein PilX
MSKRTHKRGGYMLVAVLACLSLVLALTLTALQTALRMRREVIKQHLLSQTSLLCETGVARAAIRQRERDYSGETWNPSLPELPGKRAEVCIEFLERSPTRTKVQVTAVIEDFQTTRNRVCRSLTTSVANKSSTDSIQRENP